MLQMGKNVPPTIFNNETIQKIKNGFKWGRRIHFETLGCRLNQIESEGVAQFFFDEGFEIQMEGADAKNFFDEKTALCILNTCAVTSKAVQKARQKIRLLLKKFPRAILIVTGCYATLCQTEISKIDERIVVVSGLAKSALCEIPKILLEKKTNDKSFFLENQVAFEPFKFFAKNFFYHSRASVKIQDGCNSRCSYCTICLARGKSVSIEPHLALRRIQKLESAGHNEVVLTGVNVGQYCANCGEKKMDVADLLEMILENTQKIAIRFSSIYPEMVCEKFCSVIKNPRVRPHFHLSVQSGSDSILKKMNRHYTQKTVIEVCNKLRKAKKNPFLACDIIAGFPTESDEDFFQTVKLLKECDFASVHAFPFSVRNKTVAATLFPKIPERIKTERVKILNSFSAVQKIKYINFFAGSVHEAILENVRNEKKSHNEYGKKKMHAVTDNFIHTEIILEKDFFQNNIDCKAGNVAKVKILCAKQDEILKGEKWCALGTFEKK